MPTPVEEFIKKAMLSHANFCLDRSRLAVGTDKDGFSPLLDGILWICHTNANAYELEADELLVPLCLSCELVRDGGDWSEERNLRWVRTETSSTDPPKVCHVFHSESAKTLADAGSRCTPETFKQNYRGRRNSTYMEVISILEAGYTKVTQAGRKGHVMLWRPA